MGRHEQREQLFELLFRVEFYDSEDLSEQADLFFEEEERLQIGDAAGPIREKFEKILEKIPELDRLLNEKTERWNTKRFGKVDLTVLRLALYELMYDDAIPEGVAIDEAVTIAKKYGQDSSGAFVNGVLAKFVKKEQE